MLTRKQKELLALIRDRLQAEGVPPSFEEMKLALGLKSKSGIHRLITGLEERGFLRRLPHRARALEILKLPEGLEKVRSRKPKAIVADMAARLANAVTLPLYGRIAAGTPIEALRDSGRQLEVPAGLIANLKGRASAADHYALEVSGDSMIEAGIMDGDQVIIRKADTAENGAIVVALVDGHEATLKTLKRQNGKIALIPANARYETRLFEPGRVAVQGQLVGLVRKY